MRSLIQRNRVLSSAAVLAIGVALLVGLGLNPQGAAAQQAALSANLGALNNSGVQGQATVTEQSDGRIAVTVTASGVSAGVPHAQHIHIGGQNICPPTSAAGTMAPLDLIDTAEGQPFYGEVRVSLTTEGDVSATSGLAVDRFPVGSTNRTVTYTRTFDLPTGVTMADVMNGVIVVHGFAELFGDQSTFDGTAKSSLDPTLPLEATIPVACGKLAAGTGGTGGTGGSTGVIIGIIPPAGSIAFLVTGQAAGAADLSTALASAGCPVLTLAVIEQGEWKIYINGAPATVNANFPTSLGVTTAFFVRCSG